MNLTCGNPGNAVRFGSKRSVMLLLALAMVGTAPVPVLRAVQPPAVQDRGPVQRVVHGRVENKAGVGIKGAVVYLKDSRSSSVRSSITVDDGSYRFVQLSASTDYELWAQIDTKKSPTKSISSFDSKNDIIITLKIDQ